jgi:hypothetical protein
MELSACHTHERWSVLRAMKVCAYSFGSRSCVGLIVVVEKRIEGVEAAEGEAVPRRV